MRGWNQHCTIVQARPIDTLRQKIDIDIAEVIFKKQIWNKIKIETLVFLPPPRDPLRAVQNHLFFISGLPQLQKEKQATGKTFHLGNLSRRKQWRKGKSWLIGILWDEIVSQVSEKNPLKKQIWIQHWRLKNMSCYVSSLRSTMDGTQDVRLRGVEPHLSGPHGRILEKYLGCSKFMITTQIIIKMNAQGH